MKKIICIGLVLSALMMSLVGCTSGDADKAGEATMKDGKYRAEYSAADSHGWTDYLEVTVEGGKITASDYNSLNADGDKKSENTEYDEAMKGAESPTWPSDFIPKYNDALLEKQDAEKVDAVAGATNSADSMKALYKALVKNMEKGTTDTVKIDQPAEAE